MILLRQLLSEDWQKPRVPQIPDEIDKIAVALRTMQGIRPNSITLKPLYTDQVEPKYIAFRLDSGDKARVVKTTKYYVFIGTDLVFKSVFPDEIIKFLQNNL